MAKTPRGVRNNNPGNIRKSKDPWQGLAEEQTDKAFFCFKSSAWGIRALARVLITYYDKHGCNTVKKVIRRWAPPNENNTSSYVAAVSAKLSVSPDAEIDLQDYAVLKPLVEAIIAHENAGYRYPKDVVDKGLEMAGVVPPVQKSTVKAAATNPKVIAATVVSTATAAQQAIGSVSEVWDSINALGIDPRYLMLAFGIAAGAVAAWFVIDWLRSRRAGLA